MEILSPGCRQGEDNAAAFLGVFSAVYESALN
jgi:hypothetical protein